MPVAAADATVKAVIFAVVGKFNESPDVNAVSKVLAACCISR